MFGDMDEIFAQMMGGGGQGGGRRRRKGRDIGHALPVTLEDLYLGKKVTVPREKVILCPACKGSGAKPGAQSGGNCTQCRGQGVRMAVRQLGPGMVQQMQVPCDACGGQGRRIEEKDKCTACKFQRTKTVDAPLEVNVERGMEHEQQIPFPGEGDQHPDIEVPGAIVMVLQQLKHDRFTRKGMDLFMTQKLSLAEALCGFQFVVKHLDGRSLVVASQPGEIIKPGETKCITGEGMPKWKDATKFGDLVIEFTVEFPQRMEGSQIDALRLALPPPPSLAVDFNRDEAEECYLNSQPLDEVRKEMERQAADDGDDDDGPQSGGIQCAHQ